jgi:hypothetical protein
VGRVSYSTPEGFSGTLRLEWVGGLKKGDRVGVRYDPAAPKTAIIDTFLSREGQWVHLVITGTLLLLFGGVLCWALSSGGWESADDRGLHDEESAAAHQQASTATSELAGAVSMYGC